VTTRPFQGIALAIAAMLACGCAQMGGAGGGGGAPAGRIDRILASGELRVGLTGSQPPLNVTDRDGELIGLEVDLVRALARSMGVEVRFVPTPFAELLPALERGELDMVASGLTITPERNARVAFAGPYLISGKSLLTRSDELANADSVTVLDDPQRSYSALAGSTSERFVKELLPSAGLRTAPDYDAAVKLVLDDQVDAMIADFPICALSVMRHQDAGLVMHHTPFTIEPIGIALPADDPLLVNLVENYLRTIDETGILTTLKAKWFTRGDWIQKLP
jgi:polar amino acid transport system substrate-binding protein